MNTENMSENIKGLIITLYKTLVYAILLFTFMFVMRRANYALWQPTRTSAVTAGSFAIVLMLMQSIYGNFEIGLKKSKPVFLTTMISVLIADFIAAVTMILMGIIQFPLPQILLPTLLFGVLTYILQGLVIWITAHIGNDIFFRLHKPATTIIISTNDLLLGKIKKYVLDHDKQYDLIEVITDNPDYTLPEKVDTIFVLGLESNLIEELTPYCYRNNIHLIYNARLNDVLIGKTQSFVIDDVLLIESHIKVITFYQAVVKRLMDITGALILLFLSIPVYIIVGVAIKLEDKGPILYSQTRLTKNAREFEIYKFRSMKVDSGFTPATENDDRITKVGHIIRKLRIDELPQAINILKGDISLVGPRPENLSQSQLLSKTEPDFELRLKVKGGLTGYAQIFGKYNTTPRMKLLLDLKYIDNFSLLEDIKLILQTFMVFVRPDSTEGFSEDN